MKIYIDVFSGKPFQPSEHLLGVSFLKVLKMHEILTDLKFWHFLICAICWFSGDELFSDTYKVTLKDNVMYEVVGKVSLGLGDS